MNGYSAYTLFLAMKQHFTTSSYDYYRFNGKVRASQGSFEKRKDKYFFEKLGKVQDPQQRVLANMLKDVVWIKDVVSQAGEKIELEYIKNIQALSRAFKSDLNGLTTPLDILLRRPANGTYPPLLSAYINDSVSIQTMLILDGLVGYLDHWNNDLADDLLWPDLKLKIEKYKPFLTYNQKKMRQIAVKWMETIDKYPRQETVTTTPKQPQLSKQEN
jgi:hypothetical protein